MKRLVVATVLIITLASTATAQTQTLPMETPAEREAQQANRALLQQERQTQQSEQTQFEINQLRMQNQQNATGGGLLQGCPRSSMC